MSRQSAADRRLARQRRVFELQMAVEKMASRMGDSKHSAGLWASHDPDKSQRHHRAATRQTRALWRLLAALATEATR